MSDTSFVVSILAVFSLALFAVAPRLSEALVRYCARRLTSTIALRMEEEWLGELNAITNRPGKLAFSVALFLTRRQAFGTAGEDSMSVIQDHPTPRLFLVFGTRKAFLILTTLFFTVAGYGASFLLPVRYKSESMIQVGQQDMPREVVPGPTEEVIKNEISALQSLIQSRTNLLAIVHEFNLQAGRKDYPVDRVIEDLRKDISIRFTASNTTDSTGYFSLSYIGNDPKSAQSVTLKLTRLLINASNSNRENRLDGTRVFLRGQLDDVAERLTAKTDELARERAANGPEAGRILAIEYEMLVSTYKALLAKDEDSRLVMAMESQQKGATFLIVDEANLGTAVVPNRAAIAGIGALVGLLLGGMGIVGSHRKHRRALA